jgi:hypothetical protein
LWHKYNFSYNAFMCSLLFSWWWHGALHLVPYLYLTLHVQSTSLCLWYGGRKTKMGFRTSGRQTGRFNDLASASLTVNLQYNDVYHCLGADEVSGESWLLISVTRDEGHCLTLVD